VLEYDRAITPQERSWDCGPASTQVVLSGLGVAVSEDTLIAEIGTTTNGTDDISWIENRCLDRRFPGANYSSVYLPHDPPSQQQIDALWSDGKRSIDAGFGFIMNWWSPPSNRPTGVFGSPSPNYGWNTIKHYVPSMGWREENGLRAFWVPDPGFATTAGGYWVSLEKAASLITPKGYLYANAAVANPVPVITDLDDPVPSPDQVTLAAIAEGRRRGITPRGIVIETAVELVEANRKIYANPNVPESMRIPHNAVGYDSKSVGPNQQQVVMGANGWWWGDARTCMDATLSAGLFYDRLVRMDYNSDAHSPGWYAAEIQQPAAQYRGRYDERMAEAQAIYDRLVNTMPADPFEEFLMSVADDLRAPSLSIYADPGEEDPRVLDMIRAQDAHGPHEPYVENRARKGYAKDLDKVVRTASGNGVRKDDDAVNQAADVLAEITGKTREQIKAELKGQSA